VTHIDLKQAAAILLLGIAIGCAVSHFYFAAFIDDRAVDGVPIAMNGKLYEVRDYDREINLSEMGESFYIPSGYSHIWLCSNFRN
jgi:hypothetical protein